MPCNYHYLKTILIGPKSVLYIYPSSYANDYHYEINYYIPKLQNQKIYNYA